MPFSLDPSGEDRTHPGGQTELDRGCSSCPSAVAALRRGFPDAFLAWMVEEEAADIVVGNPHLDEVIVSSRKTVERRAEAGTPSPFGPPGDVGIPQDAQGPAGSIW